MYILCCVVKSCPPLVTLWTVTQQAPLLRDFPDKNTGVVSDFLLQGIFLTQELNPGLRHCRWILYQLSQGKPRNTGVGSLCLLQRIFLTQELNPGLLHCRQILCHLKSGKSVLWDQVLDNLSMLVFSHL